VGSVISGAEINISRFKSADVLETNSISVIKTLDNGGSGGLWNITSFEPPDVAVGPGRHN